MKMIKITLFVMMITVMTSGMALALTGTSTGPTALAVIATGVLNSPTFSVVPSNQVTMAYDGAAQAYGVSCFHLNGSRSFGGWSGSSSIYYKTHTPGSSTAVAPGQTLDTTWTAN